jgi:hypothetical protein
MPGLKRELVEHRLLIRKVLDHIGSQQEILAQRLLVRLRKKLTGY